MQSQVEVLDGKKRGPHALPRRPRAYVEASGRLAPAATTSQPRASSPSCPGRVADPARRPGDLRREISRAMHDGPAQSLTNIVLQAQIVEAARRFGPGERAWRGPRARAMVQQTLDATKSFIFDVRPMVLDDLGLVPTLRRAARDRGRRVGCRSSSTRSVRIGDCRWTSRADCSDPRRGAHGVPRPASRSRRAEAGLVGAVRGA